MCNFIAYMLVYFSFDTYISYVTILQLLFIYYYSHISHDYNEPFNGFKVYFNYNDHFIISNICSFGIEINVT